MASTTSAIRLYRVSSPRRYSHSSLAPPLARAPLCFARPGFLLLPPPSLVHPRRRSPTLAHAPRHSVGAAAQARNNEYDTPSLRTTVHLGQSHLHASVFAASHPLSPSARVAQLRAETRLRVTDQHHLRVALCHPRCAVPGLHNHSTRASPPSAPRNLLCLLPPLYTPLPLPARKHLVPPTPLHTVPSPPRLPSYPPLPIRFPRHDTIYDTFRLHLPTPGPRSAICASVDAIPRPSPYASTSASPPAPPAAAQICAVPSSRGARTSRVHPALSHVPDASLAIAFAAEEAISPPIPPLLPLPYKRYLLHMYVLRRPGGLA
ncbi:hypothetical protein B0H14DRAFT_3888358 [Mycena olivaceomarginata]|nr:hypothetical protein B0H14DRAFT_3888358 [Mycena olivaceomarginata]